MNLYNRKAKSTTTAFTLAEVLTTLMVIGIVAILTIPNMVKHIQETTLAKQRTVFMKKFEEGLKQMRVDDKLNTQYESTDDFVNEMKKYFKITQVCDFENIANCFTKEITFKNNVNISSKDGNTYTEENGIDITYDMSTMTGNHQFYTKIGKPANYRSRLSSVVFADGSKIVLGYNKNCIGPESGNTKANHFACFEYFADVNGDKGPNFITKDVLTNVNILSMDFEIAPIGLITSDTFGCRENQKSNIDCDYWLGAKTYCENLDIDGGGWKLPTAEQLDEIAVQIYSNAECGSVHPNGNITYFGPKTNIDDSPCNSEIVYSHPLWQSIFGPQDYEIWADLEYNNGTIAETRLFWGIGSNMYNKEKGNDTIPAICVR